MRSRRTIRPCSAERRCCSPPSHCWRACCRRGERPWSIRSRRCAPNKSGKTVMLTDLKYALRMLAKAPGFTIIAILTLALGIGANSAIFSVIDTVLIRPLPFSQPNQLISVWSKVTNEAEKETGSFLDHTDIRDQSQTIDSLFSYTLGAGVFGRGDESHQVQGLAVTSDIFRVLNVRPFLGRAFTKEEERADSYIVVLTYETWQRYFNSDRDIIG